MELPVYEIFLVEDEIDRLSLSLVNNPAIEENFIFFNKNEEILTFVEDQMIVKGPAIIPNLKIYRNTDGESYYAFLSKETTRRFAELLLNNKHSKKINLMHKDVFVDASIVESYFAKADNEFGVPEDSWIVSLKIKDAEVWSKIKDGTLQGFSIQAMFEKFLAFKNQKNYMTKIKEKLIEAINSILFEEQSETFEVVETDKVEEVIDEVVAETEVVVEETAPEEITLEMVMKLLNEMKLAIMAELKPVVEEVAEFKADVNQKLEDFAKQEIVNETKKEQVATNKSSMNDNPAAKYFTKK